MNFSNDEIQKKNLFILKLNPDEFSLICQLIHQNQSQEYVITILVY